MNFILSVGEDLRMFEESYDYIFFVKDYFGGGVDRGVVYLFIDRIGFS